MRIRSDGDFDAWVNRKINKVREAAERAMQETVDEGARSMRNNIATRGTAKSGKAGRIDTGKMINDVDSSVDEVSTDRVVGSFGWHEENFSDRAYPLFQERGFRHYLSGELIEPMFALRDAQTQAETDFIRNFDQFEGRG